MKTVKKFFKIIGIIIGILVIALLGAWMLSQAGDYFADILRAIPRVTG